MPVTAIVGAQWGDEGKGKITDLLAQEADLVIRYQGGNNAGHTVVNDRGTFKLHLVPSGIFNPSAVCVLGTGMVIDLGFLAEEIASLEKRGVSTANLRISERAHLIMPWHIALDRLDERERGRRKLGTTGQGVGPAYADKVGRHGIQLYEVRDEAAFRARVAHELDTKNAILTKFGDAPLDPRAVADAVLAAAAVLGDRIVDTLPIVERAVASDARVLLEGQLGAMRDLDWGIYPYVTSSNPLAGFASIGAGIPARAITRVIGVVKAYSTAVGAPCASAPRSTARPPGGRGGSAGSTRWRPATRNASTHSPSSRSRSSTCSARTTRSPSARRMSSTAVSWRTCRRRSSSIERRRITSAFVVGARTSVPSANKRSYPRPRARI